jgi:hypothetical protein
MKAQKRPIRHDEGRARQSPLDQFRQKPEAHNVKYILRLCSIQYFGYLIARTGLTTPSFVDIHFTGTNAVDDEHHPNRSANRKAAFPSGPKPIGLQTSQHNYQPFCPILRHYIQLNITRVSECTRHIRR